MESVQRRTAFTGDVPANLRCGFCGQPVQGQFYRAINRFACDSCAAKIGQAIGRNATAPGPLLAAAGAGLVAALAGGAVWAVTVHITNWNIGYLAFFIGYGVGKAVHFASGKRRGIPLQWLAAILAGIGVEAGKVAVIAWWAVDQLHSDGINPTVANVVQLLRENIAAFKQPFDLVWIAFAAFAAWRLLKAPNVFIAGPYEYKPSGSSLQFDTVEPLQPPGNS
jgi:hypothetical protein